MNGIEYDTLNEKPAPYDLISEAEEMLCNPSAKERFINFLKTQLPNSIIP